MVQFECTMVRHPLPSFIFGICYGVPFPLHAEKGYAACAVKEVEIHFAKIGFVDCKWSNLNASG